HDRVAVRTRRPGWDRARRFAAAPRGWDVRLHVRGRAHEVDRPESEVVDDVADVVLPAVQLGVTPSDRRRVRVHHPEAVIWRIPKLANPAELGATGRDLTHERSRPAPSDQTIARPVPGVIRR